MKFPRTLGELETYSGFIRWLRKYVVYYAQLEKALKERKTAVLRHGLKAGIVRKAFSSKTRINNSFMVELESFEALQAALFTLTYIVHHDSKRPTYIDLDVFKEFEFEVMVFHVKGNPKEEGYSSKNDIEPIMLLSRLLTSAESRY